MSALQDGNQILNYLDLDEKKRAIDRLMVSNEKLREDSIANGKVVDEEDYAAACQELLQKRSDIKTKCNVNHLAEYIIEVGQCLDCLNRRPVSYYNLDISF